MFGNVNHKNRWSFSISCIFCFIYALDAKLTICFVLENIVKDALKKLKPCWLFKNSEM